MFNFVLQQQNFPYTPLFLTFKKCEMKKDCSTCDMFYVMMILCIDCEHFVLLFAL